MKKFDSLAAGGRITKGEVYLYRLENAGVEVKHLKQILQMIKEDIHSSDIKVIKRADKELARCLTAIIKKHSETFGHGLQDHEILSISYKMNE